MKFFVSAALLIMMFSVGNLAAQQRVDPAEMFDKVFPLLGNWGVNYGPEGQDRGNCGGWTAAGIPGQKNSSSTDIRSVTGKEMISSPKQPTSPLTRRESTITCTWQVQY